MDEQDVWRGRVCWNMMLIDVLIGHEALGFDYVMNGDARPSRTKNRDYGENPSLKGNHHGQA